MYFTPELFQTRKDTKNTYTRFHHAYFGAFYDVYSDDDEEFHIPKECEKSLKARADFLKKDISKNPYPIIRDGYENLSETSDSDKLIEQVLGLPDVCFYSKGRRLGLDEILSSLVYDEDIMVQVDSPDYLDISELASDDYSLICAMNNLIENGFYFPDMEWIMHPLFGEVGFPCYLDETRIPKKYLKETETPEKLLMDFVMNPLQIKADDFVLYFKPLEAMSLEEKFNLAFKNDKGDKPLGEQIRNEALRLYFASLMKQIINDFYRHRFQVFFLCGFSPLDHDFGYYSFAYPYRAMGESFEMQAMDYFRPYKDPSTGEYDADIVLDKWAIHASDKRNLKIRFDFVKKFFAEWDKTHPDKYLFMPAHFLRAMGLPYQSYPYARFFDFENGDFDSFYSLFEVVDSPSIKDAGLRPLRICLTQPQYESADFNEKEKRGFFIYPAFSIIENTEIDAPYFGDFSHVEGKLQKAVSGDASVLDDYLVSTLLPPIYIDSSLNLNIKNDLDYIKRRKVGNTYVLVRDFFRNMNQGMDNIRALKEADPDAPIALSSFFLCVVSAIVDESKTNGMKIDKEVVRKLIEEDLSFYVPDLEYPYVFVGRYFFGYSKNKDGKDMVFSKNDKSGLKAISEFIKPKDFSVVIYDQGNLTTISRRMNLKNIDDAIWFFGLPKCSKASLSDDFSKTQAISCKSSFSFVGKKYRKLFLKLPLLLLTLAENCQFVDGYLDDSHMIFDYCSMEYEKIESIVHAYEKNCVHDYYPRSSVYTDANENLMLLTNHGKAWMNEKGILDDNSYSLMNVFYDEKLKMDVAVGRNFYAFGHRSDPSSFKLSESDYSAILQMILHFVKEAATYHKRDMNPSALLVYALGLPSVFVYKLERCGFNDQDGINQLIDLLGFDKCYEKKMSKDSFFMSYLSCYHHERIPLGSSRDSTGLRIMARSEGLCLLNGLSVIESNLFSVENLSESLDLVEGKCRLFAVSILKEIASGAVLMLLFPRYTTLNIEIDDFVLKFNGNNKVSANELYEFREFMNQAFDYLSSEILFAFISELFIGLEDDSSIIDELIADIKKQRGLQIESGRLRALIIIFVVFCIRKTMYWISQMM